MTAERLHFGDRPVGHGEPAYIIAEIGINHNGDLDLAFELMEHAHAAGCDAVKFQKRTPELCVPASMKDARRDTPWGEMSYLEYRERVEFGQREYDAIRDKAAALGIAWTASVWDVPSLAFLSEYKPPFVKIPSALLTDRELLAAANESGWPIVLSTGMSTMEEIVSAVELVDSARLAILHSTSTYPCAPEELNLRMIDTLRDKFPVPIGYSGHEVGLQTTVAAVVLGACVVERHITLDRAMWGSDQAASIEPGGLHRLVRDIRVVEDALGDGEKQVYPSELKSRKRLRGY